MRKLPQILNDPQAKRTFLRDGARAAVRDLDAPDLDTKLREANVSQLARALQEKINTLSYEQSQAITGDENSDEYLDLHDLFTTVQELFNLNTG